MRSVNVDIFMTIYWSDWMRDTSGLSLQEQGAYLMLCRMYWQNRGPIDDNKTRIYRSCGAQSRSEKESINHVLEAYFLHELDTNLESKNDSLETKKMHENYVYRHKRIDKEIAQAIDYKKKKAEAGRKGGASKGVSKTEAKGEDMFKPSPSPSPEDKDIKISSSSTREEEEFYFCESEGRFKGISDSDLELWAKEYPKLDLQAAIADAEKWIRTHGGQLKKQSPRDFLVGWFGNKRTEAPKESPKLSDSDRYSRYCWNTVRNIPIPAGGDKWMEKYEAREPANARRIKENCEKMYQERHKSG